MRYPKCHFGNRKGAKFCLKCGEKLEFRCPDCGKIVFLNARFCDECGYELTKSAKETSNGNSQTESLSQSPDPEKPFWDVAPIIGERKLVTVLFADFSNYTAMSEKFDPEEVHQIMDGCFKILMDEIHRYEGTINQFAGDGVTALFGAPLAHEDHVQGACQAALAIQKAMSGYGVKFAKYSKNNGVL